MNQIIAERKTTISRIITPKEWIRERNKLDYIEIEYMAAIADKYYPGWHFKAANKPEVVYENNLITGVIVDGQLIWPEWNETGEEVLFWCKGYCATANGITRDAATHKKIIDISFDVKAATTDCIKKALNTYLYIGDDIYKKVGPQLSAEEMAWLERKLTEDGLTEPQREFLEKAINQKDFSINSKNLKIYIRSLFGR